ncbi:hypothetical protein LJB88_04890, partial [Erysipelotrichaceae bacterium OttesenSCG-928-M19]|nr:hypothetical protein [Erysipelotrichaceae bacterium OttesenSCG-928-M19]
KADNSIVNEFNSETKITNINISNTAIRSTAFQNKKTYRNYDPSDSYLMGDFMGGSLGKNHNALLENVRINTVSIYGDDYLGGSVGFNSYETNNKQKAVVSKNSVVNMKIYGGYRLGGIIGYNVSYVPISLAKISATSTNHLTIMAVLQNSTITGSFYISGYSEAGGAVGLNYSAKITSVTVNAKRLKNNIYTHYDEAAGLVADNEFGYVEKANTNLNVKAKVFQAAGFCADNEGTIKSSIATGHVYSPKEAGGFVGSNLGTISSSKAYGNVYVSTRVKRIIKKKVKIKKKGKKTYKTKKYKRYYPVYSGNFAAYNGKQKYKNINLKGKITSSKYYGKRYLKNKKVSNRKYGAYGR